MVARNGDAGKLAASAGGLSARRKPAPEDTRPPSDVLLAAILENAVDAIVVIDARGIVASVNPACEKLFGYTAAELVGENVHELMPSPYREEHDGYIQNYLRTGEKKIIGLGREVEGRRKDGTTFPMDLAVSEVRVGEHRVFAGTIRDITGRKLAERALKTRIRQQRAVALLGARALAAVDLEDLMAEAVALVAENLDVDFVKILELTPDRGSLLLRAGVGWQQGLLGKATVSQAGFTLAAREAVVVDDLATEARFSGPPLLLDHRVRSGVSITIEGKDSPYGVLGAHTREPRRFAVEDVHFLQSVANILGEAIANRRHVAERARREALTRLGELAAVVAHEVKNPLVGMASGLRMLERRLGEGFERELCVEMSKRLDDLTTLVNDILVYSRPREPRKEAVPIQLLLEDLKRILTEDPQFARCHLSISGAEGRVLCDPAMIQPVFLNLCLNAVQAMCGKGSLAVTAETTAETTAEGACRITIADSGPGIPVSIREQVFEPFFSTKGKGTGLGLSVALRVVELHDGAISIACPPEGGTRITVSLPLA
jgi:PAS domain S-box-containing protein